MTYGSILYILSYGNEADLLLYCKSDSMFNITKHIQLEFVPALNTLRVSRTQRAKALRHLEKTAELKVVKFPCIQQQIMWSRR
jgi:hypothetical protein